MGKIVTRGVGKGGRAATRERDDVSGKATYTYDDDKSELASPDDFAEKGGSENAIRAGTREIYDPRTRSVERSTIMQAPKEEAPKTGLAAVAEAAKKKREEENERQRKALKGAATPTPKP